MNGTSTTGASSNLGVARFFSALRGSLTPADWLFKQLTMLFALVIAGLVILITVDTAINSHLTFARFGFSFITKTAWNPVTDNYGALPFVYGTAVSSLISLLIAVPVSIGVAIFLIETAPRQLAMPISFVVQLLAAIPSVVY